VTTGRIEETGMEEVVRRAGRGEPEAFAELYRQFGRRVFGLCKHMLGSKAEAEDARSEIFLRLQRMIGTYDSSLPFSRWLLSAASHYCVDLLRRRRVETRLFVPEEATPAADSGGAGAGPSPLVELLFDERRGEIREALARLPDNYRIPLVLRYYGEASYDEIAAELGLKRNHVATLIFRAKQELRARLGAGGKG
jgi:RNA polymerase sigma-70 factor (ECF subfamily)